MAVFIGCTHNSIDYLACTGRPLQRIVSLTKDMQVFHLRPQTALKTIDASCSKTFNFLNGESIKWIYQHYSP